MDDLITRLQAIPPAACRFTFFAALAFGVFIELCQKMTGYRSFSVGDILADGVGILGNLGLYAAYQGSL